MWMTWIFLIWIHMWWVKLLNVWIAPNRIYSREKLERWRSREENYTTILELTPFFTPVKIQFTMINYIYNMLKDSKHHESINNLTVSPDKITHSKSETISSRYKRPMTNYFINLHQKAYTCQNKHAKTQSQQFCSYKNY